jgi:hypothetical protein
MKKKAKRTPKRKKAVNNKTVPFCPDIFRIKR